jgi:glycosyltransferase involved in cell wall biosynthesis
MLQHICFIPPYAYPKEGFSHGGIGSFTKSYLQDLVQRGFKITLIEFNKKPLIKTAEGMTIIYLKKSKIRGFSWLLNAIKINTKLEEIHKQHAIDIIESAELGLAFIKKKKDIKYIIRLHGGHHFFAASENRKINIWKGYQEKVSFIKADAFIAVSNYVKQHTNEFLSYNNKPIEIIPSTVNFNLFKPNNDIVVDQNNLLFAGRLCEKKGIKNLILAMPKVLEHYPNIILTIYGKDSHLNTKSYKEYLFDEIISKIGVASKNVVFKGEIPIEELAIKYTTAKVCVFPSYMETQGLVVIEAMAMKKAVIFSKYGPGKEIISHQVNGLLCDPYDVASIANEILWALDHPKEIEIIEGKALETITTDYNLEDIANRNIHFYNHLLDQ